MVTVKRVVLLLGFVLILHGLTSAQSLAVKSNILYDATTTLNVGVEGALAPRWTLDVSANYNPWTLRQKTKIRQLTLQPEARYWFCQKFAGHFIGIDLLGGIFNIGNIEASKLNKENRYEGWDVGGGIAYGYDWMLSSHWNLEATIAAGYVRADYQTYRCTDCGRKIGGYRHANYVGPTKAAISIIYLIK